MNDKLKKNIKAKGSHNDDLIDHYWGAIEYISNLVKASEIKAGLILSFYGIVLNLALSSVTPVMDAIGPDYVFYVITGVWACCIAISIYYSIKCFMPRILEEYEKNIFFFGDIISAFGDIKSFSKTFYEISIDEDKVFDQLGQQIYVNSLIATEKFKNVNKSLRYLAIGLVIFLIMAIYYSIRIKITVN